MKDYCCWGTRLRLRRKRSIVGSFPFWMPFQSRSCSRVLWAKLESIGAICMWRLNLLAPALAPCSRCSSVTTRSLLFLHDEDDNDVSSNNPLFFLYKDFLANIGFISWSKDQKRKKYWIAFFHSLISISIYLRKYQKSTKMVRWRSCIHQPDFPIFNDFFMAKYF